MNEIRKQIIELIEPYMEKDLSRLCLIEYYWDIETVCRFEFDNIFIQKCSIEHIYINLKIESDKKNTKILWHYDITAVLKYLHFKTTVFWMKIVNWNSKYIEIETSIWTKIISNKPLHLYTPQEEKELLKLLKKL